uniref:Histone-binding protein RBBP4-like N-terminal domain-containing protein n=1 Tax=Salix viminalis TaxID=40686 RepID=A0A6N2L569_SALVM
MIRMWAKDQLDEEFSVWKKSTSFLYDFVIAHPLEWPSLTVHWVPLATPLPHSTDPSSFSIHKLVLGTHTSDDFPHYLLIADAVLPTSVAEAKIDIGGSSANSVIPKVEITQKIRVDGEVNKARSMPQNPAIAVAKTSGCDDRR